MVCMMVLLLVNQVAICGQEETEYEYTSAKLMPVTP